MPTTAPHVAVMVTGGPAAIAVTRPEDGLTVATVASLEVHVTVHAGDGG